ncbi:MAG TPA: IDEAL domain-containing protein [Bacillus sp. (in: firmicutes)]|uniref:IDEAL domain-containing protein n=1 Tax=Bacillus litorisediminis TaxID=2922713 RepID=UPI001FAB3714|nr:IDEAL domain-containing protein [Bacillus litorisediminis]HWO75098.1 IDEAL domain-containing protein [Bacillus sp. (in: firmicutes)]
MTQRKSYSDSSKAGALVPIKSNGQFVLDLYIESLFFEAFLQFHSDRLMSEIDEALDQGDIGTFHKKAKEYKKLQSVLHS